ncbi:hypothetical protein RHSIM_Rhsim05G0226200 [Rhododendron simsii]|uniref:Cation/H+ exchanger domain-containing protein n=1 Tax=Rhododendron simsii TaxID=118357 RepID=A0A834GXY3_RHOSS|nr:hypothetical protein RHSIM_Rhsim05G0226200 [Rhododendron simsii]
MSGSSSLTNASLSIEERSFCVEFDLKVASRGIFLGDDPLKFAFPLLLVQLGLVTFLSATFRWLLKPFRQPTFVADILGGIALGPSFLGHNEEFYQRIFPKESLIVLDVCGLLGILFFTFLVGMRTDVTVIKKAGGLSLVIGITSFCLPMLMTRSLAVFLRSNVHMDRNFEFSLYALPFFQSIINFHGIYSILTELKLLNSELGRLALSSSMISTLCGWSFAVVVKTVTEARQGGLSKSVAGTMSSRLLFVFFIMCFCRPMMFWMIKRTPEGKTLKEHYVCTLSLMVFAGIFYCEVMGIELIMGVIFLGMAVPAGSPLGSGLIDKLELFVSAVLLPSFMVSIGRRVDVYGITLSNFGKVELFIVGGFLGKVVGAMVPSIFRKFPVADAFWIGLLMSCQGFVDISFFSHALYRKYITKESFSIMVLMATLQAGIIKPLVRSLYDPSRKNTAYKRRTIQHSRRDTELRILACICHEDNVPAVINILEASNPTSASPIGVYVLELVELVGQAMPLLINHQTNKTSHSNARSDRIVKAFSQYQIRNQEIVAVQCFTSIAPYATIHDDICSLALEKITSLVIIPFQKFDSPALRVMQNKVLQVASCSVGILIDRAHGILKAPKTLSDSWFTLHVCVIFIGGPDDREALAYGTRMAEHPNINITVIRIYEIGHKEFDLIETQLDLNAVNDFRIIHADNSRAVYKDVGVSDGPETAEVLHSLSEGFDLMLVGRRRDEGSSILMGLSQWCEVRELGVIGDMLTSSDYKSEASVLVVQQQASVVDDVNAASSIQLSRQYL